MAEKLKNANIENSNPRRKIERTFYLLFGKSVYF